MLNRLNPRGLNQKSGVRSQRSDSKGFCFLSSVVRRLSSDSRSVFVSWWQIFLVVLIVITVTNSSLALSARSHYLSGNDYLKKGVYPLAIDEYKKAIGLNPYYKDAYHGLGKAYYAQGLYEEAETSLNKTIELDVNCWQAYNDLALVYERQNLLDKAKQTYEKALKISPQIPDLHFNLARILAKDGKDNRAIAKYQETLRIDPGYIWAYINLGTLYSQLGDLDRAAVYYKEALRYDPKNTWAYINLGDLYRKRGWDERAVSEYKKALHILPNDVLALSRLSNLYMARQEWDEAIEINRKIVGTSPKSSIAHYSLGRAYQMRGDLAKARNGYTEALAIDPYDEVARFYLENVLLQIEPPTSRERRDYANHRLAAGNQYFLEGRLPLAAYAYQRAISLSPQDPSSRWRLAELFAHEELINQAIDELIKVRELDPANEDAKLKLEQMYRSLEKSIYRREEIDPASVPPSGVRMLLIKVHPEEVLHPGISDQMDDILSSILTQSPQVSIIPDHRRQEAMRELGIEEIDEVDDLYRIGEFLDVQYILWGRVSEGQERLEIKADLIELATLNDVKKVSLVSSAKDRIESLSLKLSASILEGIPLEGIVIKINPQEAIINLGTKHGLKVGARLNVRREGEIRRDPQTGEMVGKKERVIGQLEVTKTADRLSKARILTYGLYKEMKRGDLVSLLREEEK